MKGRAPAEAVGVILVEPRFPGNVGSVARAMANMGFKRLLLVNPCETDHPEARQMALNALPILRSAEVHGSLPEALGSFQRAVATTCRRGALRKATMDPRALAGWVLDPAAGDRVALVFGPEDRGLTNEEVALCQAVATIPSSAEFASLNLSHAVMVILWELRHAMGEGRKPSRAPTGASLADMKEVERMYAHLEEVLLRVGYLNPDNPRHMIRTFRNLFNRTGLEKDEVQAIRGIFRQFDWYMETRRRRS